MAQPTTITEHQVEIAPFFCPFDYRMHADADLVHRRSGEWASRIGLARDDAELERWYASTSAIFYGGMVPYAPTDRYQIAANWVYWGFFFDDGYCDEGGSEAYRNFVPTTARLLRMLDSGDERLCGTDRYLRGLCDLMCQYRRMATHTQTERWITAHRRWLFGVVQQLQHRASGGPASVDEYLITRLHDCGGAPTQAMFEFANDAEVSGDDMDSAPVRALTELFWMIAALDNDRVSRHKEILGQRDPYNLVNVLSRVLDVPEPAAMERAIVIRDRLMLLFIRLGDQIMTGAATPLRTYVESLGLGLRSNIEWSLRTPRYSTLYAADGLTETGRIHLLGRCVDTPADTSLEPLPYPSIVWWWDQLRS